MEEAVNKKADESKKKKRTSLKSILGGDILAIRVLAGCWRTSQNKRKSAV